MGVDILNETAVKGEGAILAEDQGGLGLDVDDGLVLLSRCPGSFESGWNDAQVRQSSGDSRLPSRRD